MEQLKANYEVGYRDYRRQHLYTVGDKEYPSVSKIIDIIGGSKTGALMAWSKNVAIESMAKALNDKVGQNQTIDQAFIDWLSVEAKKTPDKIKDEAASIGNQVHNAIDSWILTGNIPQMEEKAKQGFDNFISWVKLNDIRFVCGDVAVASVKYGYGGRPDAIGKQGNKYVLFDWKTSNGIRDTYAIQTALYQQAIKETFSIVCSKAFVVRFGKDIVEMEEREVNIKNSLKAALSTIRLFNSFKSSNLWKTKEPK